MAIPAGTTARQLGAVARWMLAGVVIVGMLTWWWPGYRSWGALAAGVAFVLALWLTWRVVSADRTVPGHPAYLILLAPAAVLTVHLAGTGLAPSGAEPEGLAGAIDISMLYQMALLAAGIMLTQSLLPGAAAHAGVLSACGAAMMGGSVAAMVWGHAETMPVRGALTLLAFSGVAVWLCPLWSAGAPGGAWAGRHPMARRELRAGCVVLAVAACAVLAWTSPLEAIQAAGITGGVLVLGGVIFPAMRRTCLLAGGAAVVLAAGVMSACRGVRPLLLCEARGPLRLPATWFGLGEAAFPDVSAADNGLVVLGATIGWVGLGWLLVGLALCIIWLLCHAQRTDPASQGRALAWTVAVALASAAMLMPGGLFTPSVTLAAAFTWGLLPMMLARKPRRRTGVFLLGGILAMLVMLGLARADGLPTWSLKVFGGDKNLLHVAAGFLLAMTLAWLLGARRTWAGLGGVLLAAAIGGGGELVQKLLTPWRVAELSDLLLHLSGCGAAAVLYLIAMGARWCESPDVRAGKHPPADPYARA